MLAFPEMSGAISREEVKALAALARLELADDEVELFVRQLGDILEYANQVQQVPTAGVPPTASVAIDDRGERDDEVRPSLPRADALANAPDSAPEAGFFRVPRVIG